MRQYIILGFLAFMGILSTLVPTKAEAQVELAKPVSLPYSISHTYELYSFDGDGVYSSMSFVFNADGSVRVTNGSGESITLGSIGSVLLNVTQDGALVTQHFTDIDVIYDFGRSDNQVKIAYKGTGFKRYQFSVMSNTYKSASIGINEFGTERLKYNWDDAYGVVKADVMAKTVYFDATGSFDIDPSVVDTTTVADLIYPNQRKNFYANGRHWVFYLDDGDMYVNSSADGSTWLGGAKVTDLTLTTAGRFAVTYDGTYMHYVVENSGIKYRMGTPNADGSITWVDSEQLVENVAGTALAIATDSNGYPWVSYYDSTNTRPKAAWSTTKDGTWTNHASSPHILAADTTRPFGVASLGSGHMYVGWSSTGADKSYGAEWNGTAFEATESNILDANDTGFETNLVCSGGQVYVAYMDSSYDGWVAIRDTEGAWGTDTELYDSGSYTYPCLSALDDEGDVRLWYSDVGNDNDVCYRDYIGEVWGDETLLSEETALGGLYIGASLMQDGCVCGIMFMEGASSPYNLKYGYTLDTTVPSVDTDAADDITYTTATLNGDITADGCDTVTTRGFEYDTDSGAPYASDWHEDGSFSTGVFDHGVTSLSANTTYYYRAYAENGEGTGYGDEVTFNTTAYSAPTVVSYNATDIGVTEATLNGEITDIDGINATARGFKWDTDGSPYDNDWHGDGDFGTGTFDHAISGLSNNTTYYWVAYATNDGGTGYSDEGEFTTYEAVPEAPTDFAVTQTGSDEATLTWTMGLYATNTTIRAKSGSYPSDTDDGWLVYDATDNTTATTIGDFSLNGIYFRAWSWNGAGYSEDYASTNLGVNNMLMFAFIGFAGFMTWMCSRRRQLLLAVSTFLIWFGMAMWLWFSDGAVFDLTQSYAQIFCWVFFIMSIVPFVLYANVPILHQKYGQSWTTYGDEPRDKPLSAYDEHRRLLRSRGWGRRRRKW